MIEVNEYVRTKNGLIGKVDSLYGMIENTIHLENQKWIDTKSIVKYSKHSKIQQKANRLNRSWRLCKWKRSKTYCYV